MVNAPRRAIVDLQSRVRRSHRFSRLRSTQGARIRCRRRIGCDLRDRERRLREKRASSPRSPAGGRQPLARLPTCPGTCTARGSATSGARASAHQRAPHSPSAPRRRCKPRWMPREGEEAASCRVAFSTRSLALANNAWLANTRPSIDGPRCMGGRVAVRTRGRVPSSSRRFYRRRLRLNRLDLAADIGTARD